MRKNSTMFLKEVCTFFSDALPIKKNVSLIIVSHILPDKKDFIDILSEYFTVSYIIPKPNSIDKESYQELSQKYAIWHITRDEIKDRLYEEVIPRLNSISAQFIIIDIWWYFANVGNILHSHFWDKMLWIIEDTENGHQKYETLLHLDFPLISVARSILKEPEDYLVGESVVFSTDYVLRTINTLLRNQYAVIIGFWKIGQSIATQLHWRNLSLGIYDIDPYKWIKATSLWYDFLSNRADALKKADIVFCSTWNFALKSDDFDILKDWCIIASVTSSDDELDIDYLINNFSKISINKYISRYDNLRSRKSIFLLNDGNAINFINNAVVWTFIFLVQAEIITWLTFLLRRIVWDWWIFEIPSNEKKIIASIRLKFFNS